MLKLARRFPVTVAAWIFAAFFWSNDELRNGLLFSGLAWIPLQLGLTGMMRGIHRPSGSRDWQWIALQAVVTCAVAFVCIMGDMAAEPDRAPRVFDALLLGAIAAYGVTRFTSAITEHDAAPGSSGQGQPPAIRGRSLTDG